MIPAFLLSQDLMVSWVKAWMAPLEATFRIIESEFDRQRTNMPNDSDNASRMTPQHLHLQTLPKSNHPAVEQIDQPSQSEGRGIISWLRRYLPWPR